MKIKWDGQMIEGGGYRGIALGMGNGIDAVVP